MANLCPFYLGVADGDLRPRRSILHNVGGPCKRFPRLPSGADRPDWLQKGIGVRKIQTKRKMGCVCRTLPDSEVNQLRQEHWPVINAMSDKWSEMANGGIFR